MQWHRLRSLFVALSFAALLVGACSDDESGGGGDDCPPGQEQNALTGNCQPIDDQRFDAGDAVSDTSDDDGSDDGGIGDDAQTPDDSGHDGADDAQSQDVGEDTTTCPDRDGDGVADETCGGTDCNDDNATVAPGMPEVCDEHDNDCDGQLNQGIQCAFYAHSYSELYLVDPFQKTASPVTSVPDLFDMDTHPDGTLYGITSSQLYEFDSNANTWSLIGSLGIVGTPNGLAINNQGTAFITASNDVYNVDLTSGSTTSVGSMGGAYNSSGDCVVNKDNSLYMSSSHSATDTLVLIDGTNAQVTEVGPIGFESVYGLTAAWGRMFGLTGAGTLIEIDTATGQATELHTFSSISWYGAASTPQR